MRRELLIPIIAGFNFAGKTHEESDAQKIRNKIRDRAAAINMMKEFLKEKNGNRPENYAPEAEFYVTENDNSFAKARV